MTQNEEQKSHTKKKNCTSQLDQLCDPTLSSYLWFECVRVYFSLRVDDDVKKELILCV